MHNVKQVDFVLSSQRFVYNSTVFLSRQHLFCIVSSIQRAIHGIII